MFFFFLFFRWEASCFAYLQIDFSVNMNTMSTMSSLASVFKNKKCSVKVQKDFVCRCPRVKSKWYADFQAKVILGTFNNFNFLKKQILVKSLLIELLRAQCQIIFTYGGERKYFIWDFSKNCQNKATYLT